VKLLAFETATEACSVAVWVDGEVIERFDLAPRRHAELALPWAEDILREAGVRRSELDAIAVGRGPGAFSGVRLAIAIAQGIALALDRPIVPVSTLAALALQSRAPRVLAAIDARMGEVYAAAYRCDGDNAIPLDAERVVAPNAVVLPDDGNEWIGVGTGFDAGEGALRASLAGRFTRIDAAALPHAADVARIAAQAFKRGESVAPERIEPAYLRDNVALTLVEQQAARQKK
jgi:tRNA threonylcarbamoyladenosine biosynthesis protein TsaB